MMLVSDYLHKGAENPQTAKELCNLLHLDKRALTAAIERERRQGSPIVQAAPPKHRAISLQAQEKKCRGIATACTTGQRRYTRPGKPA